MSILVIAEHDNQSLKGSTLNTVSAATLLTGDISLLVAGSNLDSVINECQTLDGISKILKCDSDTYKNVIAEKTTVTRDTIHLENKTVNIY